MMNIDQNKLCDYPVNTEEYPYITRCLQPGDDITRTEFDYIEGRAEGEDLSGPLNHICPFHRTYIFNNL